MHSLLKCVCIFWHSFIYIERKLTKVNGCTLMLQLYIFLISSIQNLVIKLLVFSLEAYIDLKLINNKKQI